MQEENGSTGLGLFIAQRIVSAIGGSLSVTSTAGAGTTFSFSFLAPLTEGPRAEWPVLARTPMQPATQTGDAAPTLNAMPADQALDELAHLALQGRLSDIARWIDVQSASGDSAPFFAALRDLLERFDFSAIQQLASHRAAGSAVNGQGVG